MAFCTLRKGAIVPTREGIKEQGFKGSPVVGYVRSAKLGDPRLIEWEAEIHKYATEHGYNLVEIVRDEGVSGVAAWMPGIELVIRSLENGTRVGVITPSIHHLGVSSSRRARLVRRIKRSGAWIEVLAMTSASNEVPPD